MNKKIKKITAIIMSALIISSVTTLTACTDASSNDKNKTTETTSKSKTILKVDAEEEGYEGGIFVEGDFPEGAKLSANLLDECSYYNLPIANSLHWYEQWFDISTANEISDFYHAEFTLNVCSADWEPLSVNIKAFVPYDKPNCHIIYIDSKGNPKEIPAEYINGKYVFSLEATDVEDSYYSNFYICSYGEAKPNAKPVQQTLTDEETGITVSGKIPPDTQLIVVDYSNINTLASDEVTTPELYYIALIRGHKEIIPTSSLTVTLPSEAGNKVGYYHTAKFVNKVWNAVEDYHAESVDPSPEYNPVIDENDTKEVLTYLENSYNNNSYTITTNELGLFGVGTEDKLNPEYLCRVDNHQQQW